MLKVNINLVSCVLYIVLIRGSGAQTLQTWPILNVQSDSQNPQTVLTGPNNLYPQPIVHNPLVSNYQKVDVPFEELETYVWDKLIASTIHSNPNANIYDKNTNAFGKSNIAVKTIPNVVNNYIIFPSDYLRKNKTAFQNINIELEKNFRTDKTKLNQQSKFNRNCKSNHKHAIQSSKKEREKSVYEKLKSGKCVTKQISEDINSNKIEKTKEKSLNERKLDKNSNKIDKIKENPSNRRNLKSNEKKIRIEIPDNKHAEKKRKLDKTNKSAKAKHCKTKCCHCGNPIKESSEEIQKEKGKITNFDQKCSKVDDVLNINLEYLDHDCECIRNSRNNGNSKKSRQVYSPPPDDFTNHYISFLNDFLTNQNYGSFNFDPNDIFPYNFDNFYEMLPVLYADNQTNKKSKASQKPKKDSNNKSSNKKRKKQTNNDRQIDSMSRPKEMDDVVKSKPSSKKTKKSQVSNSEDLDVGYSKISTMERNNKENEPKEMFAASKMKDLKKDTPKRTKFNLYANPERDYKHFTSNIAYEVKDASDESSIQNNNDSEYYPDFTAINGAYLTSSEEEEWNQFHSRHFYSEDRGEKREVSFNKKFLKNLVDNNVYSKAIPPKFIDKSKGQQDEFQSNLKSPKESVKINIASDLDSPEFKTRKLHSTEIPQYIKLIYQTDEEASSPVKLNQKKNHVETVYAPSKVINYSLPPEEVFYYIGEESSEKNICMKEGDTTIVLSKSLE